MTLDKESMFDYGLGLKSFLDINLNKPTKLKRTINPKEEYMFYVAALSNRGVDGLVRAALVLKEKTFYIELTA